MRLEGLQCFKTFGGVSEFEMYFQWYWWCAWNFDGNSFFALFFQPQCLWCYFLSEQCFQPRIRLKQSLVRLERWQCFKDFQCVSEFKMCFQWFWRCTWNFDTNYFGLVFFRHDAYNVASCQIMFSPANNKIETIPSEIGRLTMLQELFFCKCIFNDTGDTLGTLIGIVLTLFFQACCLRRNFLLK